MNSIIWKKIFNYELNKNNKIIFSLIIILSMFLIGVSNKFISYKIIFFIQFTLILFIFKKNFNLIFSKELFIIILSLIYFLANFFYDHLIVLKDFSLIFLFYIFCLLNFSKSENILYEYRYKNILTIFIFIIFFLSFKISSVSYSDIKELDKINTSHMFYYIYFLPEQLFLKRFGYFELDPNFTAIFFLLLSHYLSNSFKQKRTIFLIFAILILFATRSKAGLIYLISYFVLDIFKVYFLNRNLIFAFFIFCNLFIASISLIIANSFPTPFYVDPPSATKEMAFLKWRYENHKYFQDIDFCVLDAKVLLDKNSPDYAKFANYNKLINFHQKKLEALSSKVEALSSKVTFSEKIDDKNFYNQKYLCFSKFYRDNLTQFMNHSNYRRYYTNGIAVKSFFSNYKEYIFIDPYNILYNSKKYSDREMREFFTPHSFLLDLLVRFGFVIGIGCIFLIFFITNKVKNIKSIYPFLFGSSFLSFDTLIFLPLLFLVVKQKNEND
jgi:hypothetical protein